MRSTRSTLYTYLVAMAAVGGLAGVTERAAHACGGCFAPPGETESVVTDHRMVLSVSSQQTTLYDQIRYSGAPSSFAWVLPIADANAATLGLSADVVFASLDALTQSQVQSPPLNCPAPPTDCGGFGGAGGPLGASSDSGSAAGGVTVTKHEVVGPYVTDFVHSTDPQALNTWLLAHGYAVPADVAPVIAQYVTEHYDFIAMKLVPGAGVASMRPVRVTTPGASPVLPLRMVAAGTGATVGVTLWIIGNGRYDTDNFPSFIIHAADVVWDWKTSSSNFPQLRAQNEATLAGRGWEIESSLALDPTVIERVVRNGGVYFGGGFGPPGPLGDAGGDYLPTGDPDAGSDGGVSQTADQVREADLATLFAGIDPNSTRVTRVRSDLAHAALDADLRLKAATDQSPLSNLIVAQKEANEPSCPVYDGCNVVGSAPRSQAAAETAANNGPVGTPSSPSSSPLTSKGSCATAPATPPGGPIGAFAIAGILGVAAIRSRRRGG